MANYLFIRLSKDNTKAEYLLTEVSGRIINISEAPIDIEKMAAKFNLVANSNTKIVLIIPDQLVSYYIVDLPIREYKKRVQALPYALEDKIITDIDSTHFCLGPEINNNQYLVSVVSKVKLNNLIEMLTKHEISPSVILTDALCLYNPDTTSYAVYLNQENNLAYYIDKNIIISQLSNLNIIIEQLSSDNINIDIYKYKSEGLFKYYQDKESKQAKITIQSEHEVDNWLTFLATSWLKNKAKNKSNLAYGIIEAPSIDIKFDKLWRYIGAVVILLFFIYTGYKYYDYSVYSIRSTELNNLIKQELDKADLNIATQDLSSLQQLVNRKVDNIQEEITAEQVKDKFYILISLFAKYYNNNMILENINFEHDVLQVSFKQDASLSQDVINKIAENIQQEYQNSISLQKSSSKKTDYISYIWMLSIK